MKRKTENLVIAVIVPAFVLLGYGLLAHWDAEEADEDLAYYCAMVEAEAWPDFKQMGDTCNAD